MFRTKIILDPHLREQCMRKTRLTHERTRANAIHRWKSVLLSVSLSFSAQLCVNLRKKLTASLRTDRSECHSAVSISHIDVIPLWAYVK